LGATFESKQWNQLNGGAPTSMRIDQMAARLILFV
jgi:hypothetical protein